MKRRELLIPTLAAGLAFPTSWVQAQPYQEGTEYITLDRRVPTEAAKGKIEVVEFFWYSCPHCNAFEPRLQQWLSKLPKDIDFKRVPVRFRDDFEPQQRMYYVLEALDKVEALHSRVFQAIHVERQNMSNADNLASWAEKNGIPRAKFLELYNSFGIASKVRRASQLQEAFKVQGVPALGIGGRYYTDGSLSGSMDKALQITEYLVGEIRRGR